MVHNTESLVKEIENQLRDLETIFWEVHVSDFGYEGSSLNSYIEDDKKTYLFHGTRMLYYKICLFFEYRNAPLYLKMFTSRFARKINLETKVKESRAPLYDSSEPTMVILDDFRDFLSPFPEFSISKIQKSDVNKLKLVLENTIPIITRTNTKVTSEKSIYDPIKWVIEIIYPQTRRVMGRFIKKFTIYKPDILVPEVNSAVEYKFIRKGESIGTFLDQLKTDCDVYDGDFQYKFFYAVVVFEDKAELNQSAFQNAVHEKNFKDNWYIMAIHL